ncbi:MAG: glycoside hydrolase family 15 protein [Patescibacteria group bacterium]
MSDGKMKFPKDAVLRNLEALRRTNGTFIAAPTEDYEAVWLRDTLYAAYTFWYIGDHKKLLEGVWAVFDLLQHPRRRQRIAHRIASPPVATTAGVLHAKYHPDTLEEITADDQWGHHQLDAIGLFLYIVADLHFKNLDAIRSESDLELLQLLVYYLRSMEYWDQPDFGMWEECLIRHSSSIGAIVGALSYLKRQQLAVVPDRLIEFGNEALWRILPYESRDRCWRPHHHHDCDAAQLALIWPYHTITRREDAEALVARIIDGHAAENGAFHRLYQSHGCNRYWEDDYYRSTEGTYRGISAEWPMFKFWISIVYSQWHEYPTALHWFCEGLQDITDGKIPEAYQNGKPNPHTPLAWAHAIALIAFAKLPPEMQTEMEAR